MKKLALFTILSVFPVIGCASDKTGHAENNADSFVVAAAHKTNYKPFSSSCASREDIKAFDLRALNSSLMVAALSCNQQAEYNQLLKKYNNLFSESGNNIKTYFRKQYGSGSEKELNRFITHLANNASQGSMAGDPEKYCDETRKVFATLISLRQDKFAEFADQKAYSAMHGIKSCKG